MIGLSLWNLQKGPGKLGTTFYFHLEAGQVLMDFYLGELLLSMVDLSNIGPQLPRTFLKVPETQSNHWKKVCIILERSTILNTNSPK